MILPNIEFLQSRELVQLVQLVQDVSGLFVFAILF